MTQMTGQDAPSKFADDKLAGGVDTWDYNAATQRCPDMKKLVSENHIKFNPSGVLCSLQSSPGGMGEGRNRHQQTRPNPANGHIDGHRTGAFVIQGKAERTGWDCSA